MFCSYIATVHIVLLTPKWQQWESVCFSQAMTPVRLCVGSGIKVQRQIAEFLLPIIAEAVNFDPGILLCELSGFICRLFF